MWSMLLVLAGCPKSEETDGDTDTDTGDTDTDTDTDTGDTDTGSTTCDYIDNTIYAVWCGEETPSGMTEFISISGDPNCPTYYTIGAESGGDAAEVLADAGCQTDCVYRMNQAVMVLVCDTRGEYITYAADGPGQSTDGAACAPLVECYTVIGSGWGETCDAWTDEDQCPAR
jgi:hypothetical protein